MVFSSGIFLFLFLPTFLAIYYLTPFRWKSFVILTGSYLFYAWWRVDFLSLFVAVTVWNYVIGLLIYRAGLATIHAKRWVTLGVIGNLLTLGYFKYANFGIDSLDALVTSMGFEPLAAGRIILPIGISFYIFQAISYIVDVYRGDTAPTRRFIDFAAFIALFPQLIAGPVLRYQDLADQFSMRTHTVDKFTEGAQRFMQGFIKKVFIADSIAPLADAAFALENPSAGDAWLGALAYTAQLYFDFSGYSDMAIGLGLMMGFRFIENFNQPYISQSITEFWRRWHISLSTWLRVYLYIPLGGNRHGTFHTYKNLFLTMLLGGLWHGANWTFVCWGAWHGLILGVERYLGIGKPGPGFKFTSWGITMFLVIIGWVMFRATDVGEAVKMYMAMFGSMDYSLHAEYRSGISLMQIYILALSYVIILYFGLRDFFNHKVVLVINRVSPVVQPLVLPIFIISIFKLASQSYSPFLYFQF